MCQSSCRRELLRGKVVCIKSVWMLKCVFRMWSALVVGDIVQTWCFRRVRYMVPPCLLKMNWTRPW